MIDVFVKLLPLAKNNVRCDVLSYIRRLKETHNEDCYFTNEVKKKLAHELNEILKCGIFEDNTDVIDSALEVLYSLSEIDPHLFSTTCPDLVNSFWNIWNQCKEDSFSANLRASCLPIYFMFDFSLDTHRLTSLGIQKHADIPLTVMSFLSDESTSVRLAVVNIFRNNMDNLLHLSSYEQTNPDMFYEDIAFAFCKTIVADLGNELI